MPTVLTETNFQTTIGLAKKVSLVQFRTEWSGACQIMDPIYRELAKSYSSQASFFTVDADKEKGLHRRFGIRELPTVLFFRSGSLVDLAAGLLSRNKLIAKIENALSPVNEL